MTTGTVAPTPLLRIIPLVSGVCTEIRICENLYPFTPNFLEGHPFLFCCTGVLGVDFRFCIERYDSSCTSLLALVTVMHCKLSGTVSNIGQSRYARAPSHQTSRTIQSVIIFEPVHEWWGVTEKGACNWRSDNCQLCYGPGQLI